MEKASGGRRRSGATIQLKGNVWYICFRHPLKRDLKSGYAIPVRFSLKTSDKGVAQDYKNSLDGIVRTPSHWKHLPAGTPERVKQIWFGETLDVEVKDSHLEAPVRVASLPGQAKLEIIPTLEEVMEGPFHPKPHLLFGGDPDCKAAVDHFQMQVKGLFRADFPDKQKVSALAKAYEGVVKELYEARATITGLNGMVSALDADKDALDRQNKILSARLSRYENRELQQANVGTLRQEFERFSKQMDQSKATRAWKRDCKGYIGRFLAAVGEKKKANALTEAEVEAYVTGLKGGEGRRISDGMRKRARGLICRFLEFATRGAFIRKRVATVKEKDLRREAKEIVWLEKTEVERLIRNIPNDEGPTLYWRDLARIQAAMGWRPSEVLILQSRLVNGKTVTLEPVVDPESGEIHGKTGGRSIRVPTIAQAAIRRRLKASSELLFPKLTGANRRIRGGIMKDAWVEPMFCKEYRKILRAAAKKANIAKPVDSRTLRRTFGSLQLRAGRKPHEVAELMGDRPETVKRHYARLLAHEIDTEV